MSKLKDIKKLTVSIQGKNNKIFDPDSTACSRHLLQDFSSSKCNL